MLRDPLGLADPIFVPEPLLPILARCDGTRTVKDLEIAVRAANPGLPSDFVTRLVSDLDAAGMLESQALQARFQAELARFSAGGVRQARHAGSAGYPRTTAALGEALQRIVPRPQNRSGTCPRGLIAPHIDLMRGSAGYAKAYGHLHAREPADLYVVFGTGHKGPSAPLTGLMLDWQTPLGTVTSDREFLARVQSRIGTPSDRDVLLHKDEHSIEFQVLMLQWIHGEHPFQVAGFLTGALPTAGADPAEEQYVREIIAAFRAAEAESSQRICYVAGADLAHLGPHFGDRAPVADDLLRALEARERERLALLESGEPGKFFASVECGGNQDRICGTAPIFLTAALAGGRAELLHYGQAAAPDGSQVVSFCAASYG